MEKTQLTNKFQSAYRVYHSTESAQLKVQNDVLMNMDRGEVTALALLDLSAAFDAIDHQVLLERLFSGFEILGVALKVVCIIL